MPPDPIDPRLLEKLLDGLRGWTPQRADFEVEVLDRLAALRPPIEDESETTLYMEAISAALTPAARPLPPPPPPPPPQG